MPSLNFVSKFLKNYWPVLNANGARLEIESPSKYKDQLSATKIFQPVGFKDLIELQVPPREMLLAPILPQRSLAMIYAPRGIGKSWLALSIGLAVAAGCPLLRWDAPNRYRVLYVDGEMPLIALQERLASISLEFGVDVQNDNFQILAADHVEGGINLGSEEGRAALEDLLDNIDLVILDNLSTLFSIRSEFLQTHGLQFRSGCSHYVVGEFRSCLFIMQARMEDKEGPHAEKTSWTW